MQVEMREVEALEIEKIKGKVSNLETVVQMFMAESKRRWEQQERFNEHVERGLEKLKEEVLSKQEEIKERLMTLEKKIAWFMGLLTALSFVIQVLVRVVFR